MQYQLQCPNCGGYKVNSDVHKVNPTTNKEYPKAGCFGNGLAWTFIICDSFTASSI